MEAQLRFSAFPGLSGIAHCYDKSQAGAYEIVTAQTHIVLRDNLGAVALTGRVGVYVDG